MVKEIVVEFGGRKKKVSTSELQTLAQKKYVTPNSLIWIDGRQTLLGDAMNQLGLDDGKSSSICDNNLSLNDSRVNFLPNSSVDVSTVEVTNDSKVKLVVPIPDDDSNALASKATKTPLKILYISVLIAIFIFALVLVVFTRNDKKNVDKSEVNKSNVMERSVENSAKESENDSVEVPAFKETESNARDFRNSQGEEFDFSDKPKPLNDDEGTNEENARNKKNEDELGGLESTDETAEPYSKRTPYSETKEKEEDKSFHRRKTTYDSFDEKEELDVRKSNVSEKTLTFEYQNEPFKSSGDKIPAEFAGVDVKSLYENIVKYLDSLNLEKEPYESVKQYEKRLKQLRSELLERGLLGNITFSSKIALVFHTEASAKYDRSRARVISSYDATRKIFAVKLVEPVKSYSYLEDDEFCNVCSVAEKSGGYQAYELTDVSWTIYDIPKDQASKLLDSCAVLCVCSLQFGLDVENIPYDDASAILYTSKIGTLYRLYKKIEQTLFITKPEYWIYDERTGEIIATFTEQETVRNKRKYWGKDNLARSSNVDKSDDATSVSQSSRSSSDDADFESLLAWNDDSASQSSSSASDAPQDSPSVKYRTITIPDDAETLAEACKLARKNDHILLKKSSQPYSLGTDSTWLRLTQKLTIAGETGDPSDVVIRLKNGQSLSIQADDVSFEGITFLRAESSHDVCASTEYSNVQFQRCDFKCASGAEDAIGVSAMGIAATCVLKDCRFFNFGIYALDVDDDANVELKEGVFEKNQIAVQLRRKGSCDVQKTLFLSNATALRIENECEAIVKNCRFKGDKRVWDREAGSIVQATDNEGDKQ